MNNWSGQDRGADLPATAARAIMVGLLLLSAALVWYDLAAHDVLGRDENATVVKLDQPDLMAVLHVTGMKITGEPGNMQPLYFLLHHTFWPLVGRSAFMLRFLPSAFAVLAVVLTYKLGEALWSRAVGVLGALFTILLPLHVRYAQIARPYTLLVLLALASAYFLVQGLRKNQAVHWTGFVLTATLCYYTHYTALFVLLAEGMFTAIIWLTMLVNILRRRKSTRPLLGPLLGFLGVGLLCVPGLIRLFGLSWFGLDGSNESGIAVSVTLTIPFFRRLFDEIGLTTAWLRGLILVLMGLGLAAILYRRRWQAALFATLWLVTPFVILSLIKSPRPFEERYVIFVPPVALLMVGQGLLTAGRILGRLGPSSSQTRRQRTATIALTAALALLFVHPLQTYYVANRLEDRLEDTLRVVENLVQPGDVVVVSPRTFVRPLAVDGAKVIYLTEHLLPVELDRLALHHQGLWILYTSFLPALELQEPLDHWVQAQGDAFVRVPVKAPTTLVYGNVNLTGAEASLKDRIVVLEELVRVPAGKHGDWVRHGILADAYRALGALYDLQGNSVLATKYSNKAEETRAAAPPPW